MALDKNQIAQRIAQELKHNMYVNLGIGIPTLVANFIPTGIDIEFQSENGVLGRRSFWGWGRAKLKGRAVGYGNPGCPRYPGIQGRPERAVFATK